MSHKIDSIREKTARVRTPLLALAFGCAFATLAAAQTQNTYAPQTPPLITPPVGNSLFLATSAEGTQGYVCLPTSTGASTASWTVKGARPEATLFLRFFGQDFQVVTHFLSPNTKPNDDAPRPIPFGNATWQSSLDTSKVWAAVLNGNSIPAGSDRSCPNLGSIPCLLLQAIGSEAGPTGGKTLSKTTFIQRLNTKGGTAPSTGCATAADVGNQALVPYTADYLFYRKND